ncbi:MAG: T9SS type A sorting domain-containing protein, partial [Chitinivibrionales bacterium]
PENSVSGVIRIYSIQGQVLETLSFDRRESERAVRWDSKGFPSGIYIAGLESQDKAAVYRRFSLIR